MRLGTILALLTILIALGAYLYFSETFAPTEPPPEPMPYAWSVSDEEIQRIEIGLPKEDKSEVFVKHADRYWYFDTPEGPKVDMKRWGGGIPLILSGPGAKRIIAKEAPEEKLTEFGLTQPQMELILTLKNEDTINVLVGDSTPDGSTYYVKTQDSNDVYLVDYSWYDVLERLVKEPPYPPPPE